jgi:TonB family protein
VSALSFVGRDLLAYSAQIAAVVATGLAMARLLRLATPRVELAFAQGLLVLVLALPWLQPWAPTGEARGHLTVTVATGMDEQASAIPDPLAALAACLALGTLWRAGLLVRGVWRLRRYRRLSRPLDASLVVSEAWQRVGVRACVAMSDEVVVPAAFGLRRPVVLVPPQFTSLDPAAQRAVLCHELLHVRRRDWLQMLGEELVGALLWFHPAVWWLLARIRLAREQVVDREAVGLTRDRRVYLETLVGLARLPGAVPVAAPLFLTESHLRRRVDVLLKEVTMSKRRVGAGLAASVVGVALAGVLVARVFPLERPPEDAATVSVEHGVAGGIAGGVSRGVAGGVAGGVGGGVEGVSGGVASAKPAAEKKSAERKVIHKPDPVYPAQAKKKGIEGVVLLDVLITAAGDVEDVKVTKGARELAEPATSAVRQWKYEPGPHDTRATLTIHYKLQKTDTEKPRP